MEKRNKEKSTDIGSGPFNEAQRQDAQGLARCEGRGIAGAPHRHQATATKLRPGMYVVCTNQGNGEHFAGDGKNEDGYLRGSGNLLGRKW